MLLMFENSDHIQKPVPDNEVKRLERLEEYNIFETLPEKEFDSLVELAALVTGTPVSLMNIMGNKRQWTKAAKGMEDSAYTERGETVCQYTILQDVDFEVEDLTKDERFWDKNYVLSAPKLRSYCGSPLTTSDGYNLGALCVMDTKPKKLNQEQKKALRTIADEIMARLDLRKQQRHLENLNKEKDQFIRAINHDIKSPLNGIVGAAHYLQNLWEGDEEERSRILAMIEMSGRKLISYTSELISSSLSTGKSELHVQEVDVEEIVRDMAEMYSPMAQTKKVELNINVDTDTTFWLDDEKFKLIVSNLISNALKFSKEGGNIILHFEIKQGTPRVLKGSVTDTGIGIPQKFIPTLFEKNKENQRKGTQGEISTGLGLPIIKQMLELHEGNITVESKEDEGTTFYIEIPEHKKH